MTPAPKPTTTNPTAHHRYLSDDDEHEKYAPVGVDGLLAATEKLLAVNRGLADVDERDALPNDRIFTPDRLLSERVKLDHGKTLRKLMGRVSRARNLSAMGADTFGDYTVGFLSGNPLVPALEEINPMHIVEQKRRITKMGPGGIGDPNAITAGMQSVNASQFGFIDTISGPESEKAGIDVRLAVGTKLGSDGKIYQLLVNRRTGKKQWVSPSDLVGKTLKLPD
jgi:DNA-directed RNA polymerase beta subunit